MDIDSIFKVPSVPSGKKRRGEPTGADILKRFRSDDSNPDRFEAEPDLRPATNQDVPHSSYAPGNDPDYFVEEDEEGRFFGGGLTSEQKEILNIFDNAPENIAEDNSIQVTLPSIRRRIVQFERAVNRNQDQRSKFPDDPTKFIDSEADLDSALKSLLPLAQTPQLAFPEIIKMGTIKLLAGLLSHENIDIVIDVIELINEFTDDDSTQEDTDQLAGLDQVKALLKDLIDNGVLDLLVGNLSRLNEKEDSDRQGVFLLLGIFENVLGIDPDLSYGISGKTGLFDWLLVRLKAKEHDPNRSYCAELLSIILQSDSRVRVLFGQSGRVEALLSIISQYRKRDPVDSDEFEFLDNLFDCLCSSLLESENKDLFAQAEGVDLMVLMLKEANEGRTRALKALDYALSGGSGVGNCRTFVEAGGIKPLFSIFTGASKSAPKAKQLASEHSGHCIGIISSLLTNLPRDSVEQIRLLAKFVEKDYASVDKLLEIREAAEKRLAQTERMILSQKEDLERAAETPDQDAEEGWYLERLEGGLFQLQSVDYAIAWLAVEDDGIRAHVEAMLSRISKALKDITRVLTSQLETMSDDNQNGQSESRVQREVLVALVQYLSQSHSTA